MRASGQKKLLGSGIALVMSFSTVQVAQAEEIHDAGAVNNALEKIVSEGENSTHESNVATKYAPNEDADTEDSLTERNATDELNVAQEIEGVSNFRILPALTAPVVIACVGTVGLSVYKAYNGGDPVEYVAETILGCIPFGAAMKPAVVKIIVNNKEKIARVLSGLGATALASALSGDSAN